MTEHNCAHAYMQLATRESYSSIATMVAACGNLNVLDLVLPHNHRKVNCYWGCNFMQCSIGDTHHY